jgi:hypothetical protein
MLLASRFCSTRSFGSPRHLSRVALAQRLWLFAVAAPSRSDRRDRSMAFASPIGNLYLCAVPMTVLMMSTAWAWATPEAKFPEIPRLRITPHPIPRVCSTMRRLKEIKVSTIRFRPRAVSCMASNFSTLPSAWLAAFAARMVPRTLHSPSAEVETWNHYSSRP